MNFSSFFIKRPIFASVINVFMLIIGLVCYTKLPTFEYPQVSSGVLTVQAENAGSPPVMMEQIARTLEKSISSVSGIKSSVTTITNGNCAITITLKDDADISALSTDIENKLRMIASDLPQNMRPPKVSKRDLNNKPVMHIGLSSPRYSVVELRSTLSELTQELKAISGISNVSVSGEYGMPKAYSIVVSLDPVKMHAYGVSPQRVQEAIRSQNYMSPTAQIISDNRLYASIADASLNTTEEFSDIIVHTSKEGSIVRISDIGEVSLEMNSRPDSFSTLNGNDIAFASIMCQSGANVIQISKEVTTRVKNIAKSLPDDMKLEVVLDNSKYISSSLKRVYKTILEAAGLIAVLTLLFFKSIISSIIPLVTLPICLASGMAMMYVAKFSINMMTLLSNLLAVGLVVDDAFLVLENIYAKIERGMPVFRAAVTGMREVQFSVIAMTMTIVAVYAPFMLSTTMVGRIFKEFAFSLAGMVVASGFVALILTPMMSAKLLRWNTELHWWPIIKFNDGFHWVENSYIKLLRTIIYYRNRFISVCILIFISSVLIMRYGLSSIMVPEQDQGMIYMSFTFAPGTRIEIAQKTLIQIEQIIRQVLSDKENAYTNLLTSYSESAVAERGDITMILPDKGRRSTQQLSALLKAAIEPLYNDLMPNISIGSSPFSSDGRAFEVCIKSISGKTSLAQGSSTVGQFMRQIGGKSILQTNTTPEPIYRYAFDRHRAAEMNIPLNFLEKTLGAVRSNPPSGYYDYKKDDGSTVRAMVVTKLADHHSGNADMLLFEYGQNQILPVAELFQENDFTYQVASIMHKDGIDAINMSCNDMPGSPLEQYNKLNSMIDKALPDGVWLEPGDSLQKLIEEGNNLILMFILAIIFIYLIMAAQFESLLSPLVVMCTVPLTISGAIIGLRLFPMGSINLYSQIGMITLIALITKHGIMLVDLFTKKMSGQDENAHNHNNGQSHEIRRINDEINHNDYHHVVHVVTETARDRFRPIVMTTLAMVLGSIPLIFPSGYGYELTQQIGIVLVFGLTFGTVITTFLIPCILVMTSKYISKK